MVVCALDLKFEQKSKRHSLAIQCVENG